MIQDAEVTGSLELLRREWGHGYLIWFQAGQYCACPRQRVPADGRRGPVGLAAVKILIRTTFEDDEHVAQALRAGALLPRTSVLTAHERGLLHEWLDRIASS